MLPVNVSFYTYLVNDLLVLYLVAYFCSCKTINSNPHLPYLDFFTSRLYLPKQINNGFFQQPISTLIHF